MPYFDYYLNGKGQPLPHVTVEKTADPLVARVSVSAPCPLTNVDVWWAKADSNVMKRVWQALPMAKTGTSYEAKLPADAADWFAVASDSRPVTVSSDLMCVSKTIAEKMRKKVY